MASMAAQYFKEPPKELTAEERAALVIDHEKMCNELCALDKPAVDSQQRVHVIDVRERSECAAGMIPHAHNIPSMFSPHS